MREISAEEVKPRLTGAEEIAFVDVRELGEYGEGHPFFVTHIPYSRLEEKAGAMLPRLDVPVVLLDGGDGLARRAAGRLAALGYSDVQVMRGGAPAWAAAGFTLYQGVNLPSKTFGELVEHAMETPSITASDLKAMQEAGADMILLDGRTPEEHRRMTIPGGRFCANGELGYRLPVLELGPETKIVIHCAGRTRSIIGAQTLRNLGVAHEVVALENGTQGWELAGLTLERGKVPEALPDLSPADRAAARQRADALMTRAGLDRISVEALEAERRDRTRTHYLFDVRSAEEFAAGHIGGALHAPGGQLVQATDHWIAVRGARVVLCDDVGLRAATTALWLRGMGHDVAVLDADAGTVRPDLATVAVPGAPDIPELAPAEALARMGGGAMLLDLGPSMAYRAGHVEGARWAIRPRLGDLGMEGVTEILLTGSGPAVAACAAVDLAEDTGLAVSYIPADTEAWEAAGARIAASPDAPADAECIDYLFFTHDRHRGNLAAAQQYLDWEVGLIAQLDDQERGALRPELSLPG